MKKKGPVIDGLAKEDMLSGLPETKKYNINIFDPPFTIQYSINIVLYQIYIQVYKKTIWIEYYKR